MKFINKIIPILSMCCLTTTPILLSTSCSCVYELHLDEQEQYIYDRTFSLQGKNGNQYLFGTGWIISDATKSDTTDYKYYLATNWHVTKGMKDNDSVNFYYADNSLTNIDSYVKQYDYILFKKFNILSAEQNSVYNDGLISQYYKPAIDLNVVEVDFGKPTGKIKEKLDRLNESQKQNGYINKFAKDSAETRAKDKIFGGYPKYPRNSKVATSFGGQWESHSYSASNFQYCQKYTKYDGTNYGHAIGNPYVDQYGNIREDGSEFFNYWDVSPQYKFKTGLSLDFMSGGASGSMLLTKDFEVCGIYWGGWESNSSYYPCFSIFNTDEINFLEKYI